MAPSFSSTGLARWSSLPQDRGYTDTPLQDSALGLQPRGHLWTQRGLSSSSSSRSQHGGTRATSTHFTCTCPGPSLPLSPLHWEGSRAPATPAHSQSPCHCLYTLPTPVTVWGWREGQRWAAVTVTTDRATGSVTLTCSASSQSGTGTLPLALCPVCVCAGCLAICFAKFPHSPSSTPLGDSWVGAQLQQGWKTPWAEGCALLHGSGAPSCSAWCQQ